MATIDVEQARRILTNLRATLQKVSAEDPEQEVRGPALPALDTALACIRQLLPGNPIEQQVRDLISPESVVDVEPLRAVDVLVVVDILLGLLPEARMPRARVWSPDVPPRR
jgi:hypothetical protein